MRDIEVSDVFPTLCLPVRGLIRRRPQIRASDGETGGKELKRGEKSDCSLSGLICPATLRSSLVFLRDDRQYLSPANA